MPTFDRHPPVQTPDATPQEPPPPRPQKVGPAAVVDPGNTPEQLCRLRKARPTAHALPSLLHSICPMTTCSRIRVRPPTAGAVWGILSARVCLIRTISRCLGRAGGSSALPPATGGVQRPQKPIPLRGPHSEMRWIAPGPVSAKSVNALRSAVPAPCVYPTQPPILATKEAPHAQRLSCLPLNPHPDPSPPHEERWNVGTDRRMQNLCLDSQQPF